MPAATAPIQPLAWESPYAMGAALKRPKTHTHTHTHTHTKEKSQINNLAYHLKELVNQQTKAKVSRRKEVIKIREEINETD